MTVRRFGIGFGAAVVLSATPAAAQNWTRAAGLDTTRGVYSLASHAGVHFAVTDSLVYRSNGGLSWQSTATQPVGGVPYYLLHANDSGLFAATDGQGVHRTTNGGQTWVAFGSGLPQETVLGLTTLGDSLYAGLGFSGIYVINLKTPTTWTPYNTGLTQFGTNWIGAVGGRLFAGLGAYLFVRERGGALWTLTTWGDDLQRQAYEVVAVDSFLFAATEGGVFRARASDPLTWQAKDIAGMPGRVITSLAVQGSRLYVGLNQSLQHWIWSSDDAGVTWDVRAHEFAPVWDLRVVGNRLWAAREDGLWYNDFAPSSLVPRRSSSASLIRVPEGIRDDGRRLDGRRVRGSPRAPALLIPTPRD